MSRKLEARSRLHGVCVFPEIPAPMERMRNERSRVDTEALKIRAYIVWYILGLILLLFVFLYIMAYLKAVILLLTVSIILAYILLPWVDFFNKPIILQVKEYIRIYRYSIKVPLKRKTIVLHGRGFSRVFSILVVYLMVFFLMTVAILYLVPIVTQEYESLRSNEKFYLRNAADVLDNLYDLIAPQVPAAVKEYVPDLTARVMDEMQKLGARLIQHAIFVAKSLLLFVVMIVIVPFLTFFILLNADEYRSAFIALIPRERKKEVSEVLQEINAMLARFVRGQLLVCVIIGLSVAAALKVLGIPYAELIGIFAGAIDIIPYFGVAMGMIPAIVLAFSKGPLFVFTVFMVLYFIHWLEGHTIVPNVVGQSVGLPPLIIIVALIIGAETLGILGMFLAVPVASVLRVIINHYLRSLAGPRENRPVTP